MSEFFQAQVTEGDIVAQMQRAEQLTELHGTDYPDATYEEGVLDALIWIAGLAAAPLNEEED